MPKKIKKNKFQVTDVKEAAVQRDAKWSKRWYATRLPDYASVLIIAKYENVGNKKHPVCAAYVGGRVWRKKEHSTYVAKIKDLDIQEVLKVLDIVEINNGKKKRVKSRA